MPRPFDLNLRHLRALRHVIAQRSMARAAAAAGLSQSALTQGIGKMERTLGVALFDRRPDGVTPTPAGTALSDRATRALNFLAVAVARAGSKGAGGFALPDRLMTATQLDAFLHFADAQSFTGAAAASRLSQPAIHRAVRELEQICAVRLAERRGRGMALTTAGHALARGVRLAAGEVAAGIAEAIGDQGSGGRITIGAMPLSRALLLPRALSLLLAETPDAVVEVVEGSWRELVDPLLDGVVDLLVGALRHEAPTGAEQVPLFADRLAVFGRRGHPLADEQPDFATLAGQRWIVGAAGTPLRAHWEALFAGLPLPLVPVECGSVMVIRGLLAQSDLLTLLSPDQVALEVEAGMLVTIGPALPHTLREIGVTTRCGWRPTRAQRRLIELIGQAADETRPHNSG